MSWRDIVEHWGTTRDERARRYPCDDVLPDANAALFRGVDVAAPAALVFRWLCQLRVAPYSYDWIDNFGRRSPQTLTPGLEALAVGQVMCRIFELAAFEPNVHVTLRLRRPGFFPPLAISYLAAPVDDWRCRLVAKIVLCWRPGVADRISRAWLPAGDLVMMRRQLLNLSALAARDAGRKRVYA